MSVQEAIQTLVNAGLATTPARRFFSVQTTAGLLDCSTRWVKDHLAVFPGAFRLPGGEWRIPAADVDGLAQVAVPGKKGAAQMGVSGEKKTAKDRRSGPERGRRAEPVESESVGLCCETTTYAARASADTPSDDRQERSAEGEGGGAAERVGMRLPMGGRERG